MGYFWSSLGKRAEEGPAVNKALRKPAAPKWERVTTTHRQRKRCDTTVSTGQLYREIAEGYEYFLSARMRDKTLQQ
jgi:hypothetical protein